ncbi:putative phosphoglycerate mutase pmu1 [Recurvomyces mirabilis]|uniref:Phosphoglycerate mutase pmu1 n=1 Tax=Recurvomyces mirabilis TaxID=574656 RepID=A0AAE0TPV9_9PEZI|nr:putative phosphoglycerate mutase pmu1 [Recurvomyces mirabilis]KAK5161005.1 putative phosphoglycerate mutase pmu1 [Recurvomyces mirabilis]
MYGSTTLAAGAMLLASGAQAINITSGYINYTTVAGYFLQDVASTNASTFDYTATNFGLINQTYSGTTSSTANLTQWQQFQAQVAALNAAAPLNTVYKVLFMGRHGEGYHNAAETFYGTPAWNCYWAELNGNATATWYDADLTPNGINQAIIAHNFWQHEIAVQKIPQPQSYYSSPLTRCLKTTNLTFNGIPTPEYYPFVPTVKELLREGISIHTCDHRRNRTYIHNLFSTWDVSDLGEYDTIWNGVSAETNDAQDARSKKVLDSIFGTDDHTWLSITSHSGEIGSILRVVGHRSFSLNTGAVIPVLVKAQFLPSGPAPSSPAYTVSTHCANPPVTSIASLAQGCVCSGTAVGGITTPIYNISSDYPSGAGFQATDLNTPTVLASATATATATGGASGSSSSSFSTSSSKSSSASTSASITASASTSSSRPYGPPGYNPWSSSYGWW